jgi:Protein of unknown function, DUF417
MNRFVGKTLIARDGSGIGREAGAGLLNPLVNILIKCGLLTEDLDYHIVRAAMVIIFFSFGYQKWWAYEAQRLIPYISHGPLIFWLYPVFGVRGASWFLGSCEWSFGTLLLLGFWNKKLGILGALGSCLTFVGTVTIIPFMPDGMGCLGWRLSGHDRQRPVPDEGCRALGGIGLSAEAGRPARGPWQRHPRIREQLVFRPIQKIHLPSAANVQIKSCHTGEGRCLWQTWVPAFAGKTGDGHHAQSSERVKH